MIIIPKVFTLQNGFTGFCWYMLETKKIGHSEALMYLYILKLIKKVKWNKGDYTLTVGLPLSHMAVLQISENTWYKLLKSLADSKMIKLKKGTKKQAAIIELYSPEYDDYRSRRVKKAENEP